MPAVLNIVKQIATMSCKTNSRKTRRNRSCVFVGFWAPTEIVAGVDRLAAQEDTDRSKILRDALRRKLGVAVQ